MADRIDFQCFATPNFHEFGCWLEILLGVFGIHKAGYLWLKQRLGLAPKCGCEERQTRLDKLGAWLARKFHK